MTTGTTSPSPRIFSIVSAVHNVDRYLGDFLESLEIQSYGIDNLDIVLVDDGSTDDSLATLHEFASKYPGSVRVLAKENGGQGSARNFGLDAARGDWVTFTDPDDFLQRDYFEAINQFLDGSADGARVQLLSTPLISYFEANGRRKSDHPLNRKFDQGSRLINLNIEPDLIQLSGSSSIFDRELIEAHALRFDERVRPNFEDGHFIARFLLRAENQSLGAVADARYNYRKRADHSSTLATSRTDPRRYVDVPRHGFLAVLEEAETLRDAVPAWLQNVILYDLAWYLRAEESPTPPSASLDPATLDEFQSLLRSIRPYLSESLIRAFNIIPISDDIRFVLLFGLSDGPAIADGVRLGSSHQRAKSAKISYKFTQVLPDEAVYSGADQVVPAHTKSRAIKYYGRTLAYERILWVPLANRVSLHLNGAAVPFGPSVNTVRTILERRMFDGQASRAISSRPDAVRHPHESISSRIAKRMRKHRRNLSRHTVLSKAKWSAFSFALHLPTTRRAFAKAWVFADSQHIANDNAEHLYRYVQQHKPGLNPWFVINRDSADWDRLKSEGFRLVAYGSLKWRMLLLNADTVLSSHADQFVQNPVAMQRFGQPRSRFVYLRHGVMSNDMSNWLNRKRIDLLVASSPAEYESIVEDGSPYKFTTKEARLTGLPRHDLLRKKRDNTPLDERSYILVMPTWRKGLINAYKANPERGLEALRESRYVEELSKLLSSQALRDAAAKHNASVVFVPHPAMTKFVDLFSMHPDVSVKTFAEHNVQDLLARAALVITDYSSLAFEAAVVGAPVIYYQFDKDEIFSGSHSYREGHFDYERDGFGPVCATLDEVEGATDTLLTQREESKYHERMRAAFAHHDQGNSQRVVEAVLALDDPLF